MFNNLNRHGTVISLVTNNNFTRQQLNITNINHFNDHFPDNLI